MEEVWNWKYMSTRNCTFGGVILQDFHTQALTSDPPKSIDYSSNNLSSFVASDQNNNNASFYCPSSMTPPSLVTDFHFVHQNISAPIRVSASVNPSPYDQNVGVAASNSFISFGKRSCEATDISHSERRNKRMIKNRESAARSRARKQAKILSVPKNLFSNTLPYILPHPAPLPCLCGWE
jgi:hypothetical protein